jgi:hypothetical protein
MRDDRSGGPETGYARDALHLLDPYASRALWVRVEPEMLEVGP